MKILHAISGVDPSAGGTATALAALAAAQHAAGLNVSIVATYEHPTDQAAAEAIRATGIEVHHIGPVSRFLARHPRIVPIVSELVASSDIVHSHGLWEEIQHQAPKAARRLGVPYIITPHGMLDPWSLAQSWLKKRLYLAWRMQADLNGAAAVHYTTESERDLAASMNLRSPAIIEPNGVDLIEFDPLPQPGCFQVKHPELIGRPIILFLGRLHYKKGFDLLVPALARINHREAMLVVAGPDSDGYRAEIEQMIAREGVGDRVLFTGMLRGRDRVEAFVDADLFVLPSHQENFGVAVIESLAAGCPVIVTDRVGVHSRISAEHLGGVVSANVSSLTAEIDRWLSDSQLRLEASERGRKEIPKWYDWNVIALRWVVHYQQIVEAHRRQSGK